MALSAPTVVSENAADSLNNAVRPIKLSEPLPVKHTVHPTSFAASAAICAVVVYLSAVFAGSQYFDKLRSHATDPLPKHADVLMVGSSVIAVPLIAHEFPNTDIRLMLDRFTIMRVPKAERFLSSLGVRKLAVYNGAAIGQNIEETEAFVQGIIERHKYPRLVIVWVAPGLFLSKKPLPQHKAPNPIEKFDRLLLKIWREHREIPDYIQMRLSHITFWLYGKLNLGYEDRSKHYQRVQEFYKERYSGELAKWKVQAFARMLEACKSHSIKTMVVSAPLSASNLSLIPSGFYDKYHRMITEIVQGGQAGQSEGDGFIDLGQSAEYVENADFRDPAHCNEKGCEKMLRAIAPQLCRELP